VLLEGGPRLAGAFVGAHRVDRVLAYLAPALLGAGPSALADAGVGTIDAIERWHVDEVRRVGDDVLVDAHLVRREAAHAGVATAHEAYAARQEGTA
jgi:diaminohydroxyphosphoribosylaminopyrimidine deaminase / 5-amino-6-(5-phosphoribosylamino)uracil reductase